MEIEHLGIVHLVNMVSREDYYIFRRILVNIMDILKTAFAVPLYHSPISALRYGDNIVTPPFILSISHGFPIPMCALSSRVGIGSALLPYQYRN